MLYQPLDLIFELIKYSWRLIFLSLFKVLRYHSVVDIVFSALDFIV